MADPFDFGDPAPAATKPKAAAADPFDFGTPAPSPTPGAGIAGGAGRAPAAAPAQVAGVAPGQPSISQRDVATAKAGTGALAFHPDQPYAWRGTGEEYAARQRELQQSQEFQQFSKQHPYLGQAAAGLYGFGAGQEMAGAPVSRLAAALKSRSLFRGPEYERALAKIRGQTAGAFEASPVTAGLATVPGALSIPLPGLQKFAGPLGAARAGALAGGLSGAAGGLATTPDLTKYGQAMENAVWGGVTGAALGGTIGGLTRARPSPTEGFTPQGPVRSEAPFMQDRVTARLKSQGFQGALSQQAELPSFLKGNWANAINLGQTTAGKQTELAAREAKGIHAASQLEHAQAMEGWIDLGGLLAEDQPKALDFFDYVEGRTKGATLPADLRGYQPLADSLQRISKKGEEFLKGLAPDDVPKFLEDYVAHMVKQPAQAKQGGVAPRGGDPFFLKQRKIPTIRELVNNGYELKTMNPTLLGLAQDMNQQNWVTRKEIFQWMKDMDYARPVKRDAIPADAVELSYPRMPPGSSHVYAAPRDVANIFNNLYSAGLGAGELSGDVFRSLRAVNNFGKQMKLGLSGFHLGTTGGETMVSELGQGIGEALAGKPGMAALSAVRGFTRPAGAIFASVPGVTSVIPRPWFKGVKAIDQLTGKGAAADPVTQKIIDLAKRTNLAYKPTHQMLTQSEGRIVGERLGESAASRYQRGGWGEVAAGVGRDVKSSIKETKQAWGDKKTRMQIRTAIGAAFGAMGSSAVGVGPVVGGLAGAALGAGGARQLSRAMQSVMSPIFEKAVPQMKTALFFDKMESWLKLNPTATDAEALHFAQRLSDSMDNRLGELTRDHLFWKNTIHDSLQLAMLSPTWNEGTLREIGGAVPDSLKYLMHGPEKLSSGAAMKGGNIKGEYLAGLMMGGLIQGGLYEYFKTGTLAEGVPSVTPRTGGTIPPDNPKYRPTALPERAELPIAGYWKDVLSTMESARLLARYGQPGLKEGFIKQILSKGSPLVRGVTEAYTGEGFDPRTGAYGPLSGFQEGAGGILPMVARQTVGALEPIPFAMKRQEMAGSNISMPERMAGIRSASRFAQDPQGYHSLLEHLWTTEQQRKAQSEIATRQHSGEISKAQATAQKAKLRQDVKNYEEKRVRDTRKQYQEKYGGPQ